MIDRVSEEFIRISSPSTSGGFKVLDNSHTSSPNISCSTELNRVYVRENVLLRFSNAWPSCPPEPIECSTNIDKLLCFHRFTHICGTRTIKPKAHLHFLLSLYSTREGAAHCWRIFIFISAEMHAYYVLVGMFDHPAATFSPSFFIVPLLCISCDSLAPSKYL